MSPWKTSPRWAKGTYMRLVSTEVLREFVLTQNDIDAYKAGKPLRQKMSQRHLAKLVGCSAGFINHLTSGRATSCTPEKAVRMAEALNVPLKVLFLPIGPAVKRELTRHH